MKFNSGRMLITIVMLAGPFTNCFAESYCEKLQRLYHALLQFQPGKADEYILSTLKQKGNKIIPAARVVTLFGLDKCKAISFMTDPESPTAKQIHQMSQIALTGSWLLPDGRDCQVRMEGDAYQMTEGDEQTSWVKFEMIPNYVQIGCRSGDTFHFSNYTRQTDGGWLNLPSSYQLKRDELYLEYQPTL